MRDSGREVWGRRLVWAGVVGFAGCLLVRFVAPYPRADLLLCLAVSLLGLGLRWSAGRRVPGAAVAVGTSAGAGEAPGFRIRGAWWPGRRAALAQGGLALLAAPVMLLAVSIVQAPPQLAGILDADARVARVTVREAHSTTSAFVSQSTRGRDLVSDVTVELPGTEGELVRGEVRSTSPAEAGDRIWALYAPDAPRVGIVLDVDRAALERRTGGPVGAKPLALAFLLLAFGSWLVWRAGRGRSPALVERGLTQGRVRAQRVTVSGVHVAAQEPARRGEARLGGGAAPALRLSVDDGERHLYLERCLDATAVHRLLDARGGWLYRLPAERDATAGPECTPAVLVLDDDRYVAGRAAAAPGEQVVPAAQPTVPEVAPAVSRRETWRRPPAVGLCYGLGFALAALAAGGVANSGGERVAAGLAAGGLTLVLAGMLGTRFGYDAQLRALRGQLRERVATDPTWEVPDQPAADGVVLRTGLRFLLVLGSFGLVAVAAGIVGVAGLGRTFLDATADVSFGGLFGSLLMCGLGALGLLALRVGWRQRANVLTVDRFGLWVSDGSGRQVVPWESLAAVGMYWSESEGDSHGRGKVRSHSLELCPTGPVDPFAPVLWRLVRDEEPHAEGLPRLRYRVQVPGGQREKLAAAVERQVPHLWFGTAQRAQGHIGVPEVPPR